MGRVKKRTRIVADKASASGITIRQVIRSNGKQDVITHLVQGWKVDGKWQRRQFKKKSDAELFAAELKVSLENQGRSKKMLQTALSEAQLHEAEQAFEELGDTYTLSEAIAFFLKNHRAPDFTIELNEGVKVYLDYCERAGIRERTLKAKKSVLNQLSLSLHNPEVHTITSELIEAFLRALRAKDGTIAKRKTWNNYRTEISHFLKWCCVNDLVTHRPWTFSNPCEKVTQYSAKQIADQRDEIIITEAENVKDHMTHLMNFREGALVKFYALAYFAGIRPDGELKKLASIEKKQINLRTHTIHIPAKIAKTGHARQITISENLARWLEAYKQLPIIPTNFDRLNKEFRAFVGMSRDETRHTFISFHVAKYSSVGKAALQAGNSESIVRSHYLNLRPVEDGEQFFNIFPNLEENNAIIDS